MHLVSTSGSAFTRVNPTVKRLGQKMKQGCWLGRNGPYEQKTSREQRHVGEDSWVILKKILWEKRKIIMLLRKRKKKG